jgi:hypothetical protein
MHPLFEKASDLTETIIAGAMRQPEICSNSLQAVHTRETAAIRPL